MWIIRRFLVATAFSVFTLSCFAGTPEEILKGKVPIKQGVCGLMNDGTLAYQVENAQYEANCVIGYDPEDESQRYVLTYRNDKPDSIILIDANAKTQKVIWRNGELEI